MFYQLLNNIKMKSLNKAIEITQEQTSNQIPFDAYRNVADRDIDCPIILLTGLNIAPSNFHNSLSTPEQLKKSTYVGLFAYILAKKTDQDVYVVSQPGVAWKKNPKTKHKKGLYTRKTELAQFEAALEIADGRIWYPITHSISSLLGVELCLKQEYEGHNLSKILDGTITSVFTSVEDALTNRDGEKKKFKELIAWLTMFKIFQYLPGWFPALPLYPLESQEEHDGHKPEERIEAWKALIPIRGTTARYAFKRNLFEEITSANTIYKQPLWVITEQDNACSIEGQENNAFSLLGQGENLNNIIRVPTGHRWFTSNRAANVVADRITEHINFLLHN